MKELRIGDRFNVFHKWYDEVIEIIDVKEKKALVKIKNDCGCIQYAHMVWNDKLSVWKTWIVSPYIDGILYY